MTSLSISVVIPCHNGAPFIGHAVGSAMAQTRGVSEVIVVDDGSTDDSAAIAESLGARCIRVPRPAGPGAARNRGVAQAQGDVVAFLDADDYWSRTHCEDVVALLERHPDCAVAFSRIRRFGDAEESRSPAYITEDFATPVLWQLVRENIVPQSTAVVRRSVLLEQGGYDEARWHSEDYELWMRLAQSYPFVCTNTITANYRLHPGQATRDLERMLHGRWDVKHQFWVASSARESRGFVKRLEHQLLSVWGETLRDAWWRRDDRFFLASLALHDLIPRSDRAHRAWRLRYRVAWGAWQLLRRAWDGLPGQTKDFARPTLTSLFAPPGPGRR